MTKTNKKKLERAASIILNAFCWEDSTEGVEYWDTIHTRLEEIASGGPLKEKRVSPKRGRRSYD
jgi:hypothetical protein